MQEAAKKKAAEEAARKAEEERMKAELEALRKEVSETYKIDDDCTDKV